MKKILSSLLLSASLTAPAMATGNGVYLSADLGSYSYGGYSTGALSIAGGLHIMPNLAVEIGLVEPSRYNYVSGGTMYTFDHSVLKGAAVGFLPVSPRLDLYGKLGLARVHWSDSGPGYAASGSDINLMFGLGAKFNINPQLSVHAQYENYGNSVVGWFGGNGGYYYYGNTGLFSAGATFKF